MMNGHLKIDSQLKKTEIKLNFNQEWKRIQKEWSNLTLINIMY